MTEGSELSLFSGCGVIYFSEQILGTNRIFADQTFPDFFNC